MRTALFAMFVLLPLPIWAAEITLHGRVLNENEAPVRDAHVRVRTAAATVWEGQTDPTGEFTITLSGPNDLSVTIQHEGYYALTEHATHVESSQELTFVINTIHEVFQSENVNDQTSPIDVSQSQDQEHLSGTEVNDIPYRNSHDLRNALEMMPGVVQDLSGTLHVNGSAENQVLYLFNGFNLNNPISGLFTTIIPVEGIRSVDLSSGQSSTEYGKGSAGVLQLNTESGTDKFHYTATDFIPGINIQRGIRIGNWYPRAGISGPIIRGRAWFADTFESEFTQTLINGLPSGKNVRSGWAGSNVLHGQMNLTASNILFADFLTDIDNQGHVGLGPLSPIQTTYNVNTRQYFTSIKDQQYFGHGMLLEFGYGHNYFSIANIPQGDNLYIFTPGAAGGNYFLHSSQSATRDQAMAQLFLPKFQRAGSHQLIVGTDIDGLHYHATFHRTGYEVLGLSGQLLSETLFPTAAQFHVTDTESSAYLLDTWRIRTNLQLTLALRGDHDQSISATAWSPRVAFSWSPFESAKTKISGGYSITHDAVTLQMLGTPLDQVGLTTTYNASGTPMGTPTIATYAIAHSGLSLPRANNWNLDLDQQLRTHIFLTAKYMRRRGSDEFSFLNTLNPSEPTSLLPSPIPQGNAFYELTNLRRDNYDSVAFSVRQTLFGQYGWLVSYTRSRATSDALVDPTGAVSVQLLPTFVALPWDAPNRLLARGYAPLPWKNWAVSAFTEMRSGFPFSIRDQTGLVIGAVDSHHFPLNFDLNLAVERMLTFRGYRFALRGGLDNITNQANPTAVNSVVGAPQFLHFLGDEGRHFVVRIRFFGRSGK